ncbi:hypothetical protein F5148DRAFT_270021 [Russula earlei]|uniref:Uncharacterized protein n=1 Tax=Russula earlei TaxID=71964 RepID=A0ACC0U301_9AGAM|nr:hypothetical protein F5148DRAFT_270021 [Russula earlei]
MCLVTSAWFWAGPQFLHLTLSPSTRPPLGETRRIKTKWERVAVPAHTTSLFRDGDCKHMIIWSPYSKARNFRCAVQGRSRKPKSCRVIQYPGIATGTTRAAEEVWRGLLVLSGQGLRAPMRRLWRRRRRKGGERRRLQQGTHYFVFYMVA